MTSIPKETCGMIRTNASRMYGAVLVLPRICNSKNTGGASCVWEMWIYHCLFGMFLSVIVWHLLHGHCYSCSPRNRKQELATIELDSCSAAAEGRIYPSRRMAQAVKILLLCAKVKTEGNWGASPTVLKVGMSKWRITAPLNFVVVSPLNVKAE